MQMKTIFAGLVLAVLGVALFMAPVNKAVADPPVQNDCCFITTTIDEYFGIQGLVPINPNWPQEVVECVMEANEWYANRMLELHHVILEYLMAQCPQGNCPYIGQVDCECLRESLAENNGIVLQAFQAARDDIQQEYENMIAKCDCPSEE